jgi:hypothetical protein
VSVSTQWVHMTAIETLLNATHLCDHDKDLIWVRTEDALNACECAWMPMSEYWTTPGHPFSVHECLWVSRNSPWTPIECVWMPLSK